MSASASGREVQPFLDTWSEQEEEVQLRSHIRSNKLPRCTWTALRILGGVVALAVVVLANFQTGGSVLSAPRVDATMAVAVKEGGKKTSTKASKTPKKEIGDPFTQCGGDSYKGKACCKSGCACVRDSQFYSMCKPPTGQQTCDVDASKGEVKHAKDRERAAETELKEAGTNVVNAKKDAKDAIQALKAAKKEAKKATATWRAKDAQEKKEVEAAKQQQADVFASAESDRNASVKNAKDERATVEKAAKEKLTKTTNTAMSTQTRIVTKATESRDNAVKSASAKEKQILDNAHAEMNSVEEDAKKKATAKREAATKERVQSIEKATNARNKQVWEAKDEWAAKHDKATQAKAKTVHALKEAISASAAASKSLKKKAEELKNVTDFVTFYKQQEEMRKTKKCSTMWKDCKSSNCCSLGCKCTWHSKYYASCTGIFGSKDYCEKDKAIDKQTESMQVLPGLQSQHKNLKEDADNKAMVRANAQQKMDVLDKKWASTLEAAKKKERDAIATAHKTCEEAKDTAMKKEKELIRNVNKTETDTISKQRKKSNTAIQQAKTYAAEAIAAARKKAEKTITDIWDQTNVTIKDATDEAKKNIAACKNKEKNLIEAALKKEKDVTSDAMAKVRKTTAVAHKAAQDADNVRKKANDKVRKRKAEGEAAMEHLQHTMKILKAKRHKHAMAKLEVQTWVSAETGAISCKP